MFWMGEPPVEPGYYWASYSSKTNPVMIRVQLSAGVLGVWGGRMTHGGYKEEFTPLTAYKGWIWSQRIPEPQ